MKPLAGLGYRLWMRNWRDAEMSDGTSPVSIPGRGETWQTFYGYAEVNLIYDFSTDSCFYVEVTGRHSFVNWYRAELPSGGTAEYRPDWAWTYRAGLGYAWGKLVGEAYYEPSATGIVESREPAPAEYGTCDVIGLRFGAVF